MVNLWEDGSILDGNSLAAFGAAASQNFASGSLLHANAKAVRLGALALLWFVSE